MANTPATPLCPTAWHTAVARYWNLLLTAASHCLLTAARPCLVNQGVDNLVEILQMHHLPRYRSAIWGQHVQLIPKGTTPSLTQTLLMLQQTLSLTLLGVYEEH